VFAQNGTIRIVAKETEEVEIYNISGILLSRQTVVNETTITLNSGIYFVKSGNKTEKVVVR
ncbi:MAG: T9SS type A sorting domain-containing protein, partial [Prevotellaceae bacterium]|nr:T9SS type A sorting domain-containing protein [Prevotellaceae bacterium]